MKEKWMPDENLRIGTIIEVDGSRLAIEIDPTISDLTRIYKTNVYAIGQVGSIIKVHFGRKTLFAFVTRLRMKSDVEDGVQKNASVGDTRVLDAELFGEGKWNLSADGEQRFEFERGVSVYPLPLQGAYLTTVSELSFIYERRSEIAAQVGHYVGADMVPCFADLDELFGKHTAVLGSTGSGKSSTVVSILRAALCSNEERSTQEGTPWNPQVVILDPHNEYSRAFPDAKRLVSDDGNLSLPYWLLNLGELLDLILGKSEFQATSQTNILKSTLLTARQRGADSIGVDPGAITVDSPVPFSLSELRQLITDDMPPQASKQDKHQSILNKIESLVRDSRLSFMMNDWVSGSDEIVPILRQFIDPSVGVKIVDLSGMPNDVAGTVSAAIGRLLFMYKLWQNDEERRLDPVLFVCEEAHRYVPNRGEAEYSAAQEAIRRVAKEGRKYGIGLMLVSQRPSELDGTVLSQCNSWVVLRLSSGRDQEFVQRFLPDSLTGLARLLPSLRRQEAIFLGQAAQIPSKIRISTVPEENLPRSLDISFVSGWSSETHADKHLTDVANRWRIQTRVSPA